jgi:hypothetical protein
MDPTERRAAPRTAVPDDVTAEINGTPAQLIELSPIGAKVEHLSRFALATPELRIIWLGNAVPVGVRVVRTEIVGRKKDDLVYHTALAFLDVDGPASRFIRTILEDPKSKPVEAKPQRAAPAPPRAALRRAALDDTWTRQVNLLAHEPELPYAQFRLTRNGWVKDYVDSPAQPPDGFTIRRERRDFDEFQRTFEAADPDTRRMMQIALESRLRR